MTSLYEPDFSQLQDPSQDDAELEQRRIIAESNAATMSDKRQAEIDMMSKVADARLGNEVIPPTRGAPPQAPPSIELGQPVMQAPMRVSRTERSTDLTPRYNPATVAAAGSSINAAQTNYNEGQQAEVSQIDNTKQAELYGVQEELEQNRLQAKHATFLNEAVDLATTKREGAIKYWEDYIKVADAERDESLKVLSQMSVQDNFWADRTTGAKIGLAISVALGGVGQALTGGPNYALQQISSAIDRDMMIQRANIERQQDLVARKTGVASQARALFSSDMEAIDAATIAQYKAAEQMLTNNMQVYRGENAKQYGEALLANLRAKTDSLTAAMHQRAGDNMRGIAASQMALGDQVLQHAQYAVKAEAMAAQNKELGKYVVTVNVPQEDPKAKPQLGIGALAHPEMAARGILPDDKMMEQGQEILGKSMQFVSLAERLMTALGSDDEQTRKNALSDMIALTQLEIVKSNTGALDKQSLEAMTQFAGDENNVWSRANDETMRKGLLKMSETIRGLVSERLGVNRLVPDTAFLSRFTGLEKIANAARAGVNPNAATTPTGIRGNYERPSGGIR